MEWAECELVERVEGRCGGMLTIIGTRVFPEIIMDCLDDGMDDEGIREQYPSLSLVQIRGLIAFIQAKRSAA